MKTKIDFTNCRWIIGRAYNGANGKKIAVEYEGERYMEKFLDITPGSLSILGLMDDKEMRVRLLIDEDVLKGEYIGCHPCINTSSLKIRTDDMVNKIIPALNHKPTIVTLPDIKDE